jgi:hypothetical protein
MIFSGYVLVSREYRSGYAVLTTDESVSNRALLDFLSEDKGFFNGQVISESSQWVLLDEFGSFSQIPLDEFPKRIMPFDPRNDGYAQKLENFFVNNGKRFIFIPMESGIFFASGLEKKLAALLGDIPYSLDFFGQGKPLRYFFMIFTAAALGMFVLCYIKRNNRTCLACIIPCLPVLASLSFFSQAGMALAALFIGLAVFLWEPLFEYCVILHMTFAGSAERQRRMSRDVYRPYRQYLYFLPIFPLAILFISIYADIILWFALVVFILYCAVFFMAAWTLSFPGINRRFRPVLIFKRRFPDLIFTKFMLPFVLAAFFTAFFSHKINEAISDNGLDILTFSGRTVSETEYYDHLSFQVSFSNSSLYRTGAVYPFYTIEEDGLLNPLPHAKPDNYPLAEFPPFPLKDLTNFINNFRQPVSSGASRRGVFTEIPLLILLIFLLPAILLRRKIPFSNSDSSALKRLSGKKIKWGDKKRKKILLLINKTVPKYILELKQVNKQKTMAVRKDA